MVLSVEDLKSRVSNGVRLASDEAALHESRSWRKRLQQAPSLPFFPYIADHAAPEWSVRTPPHNPAMTQMKRSYSAQRMGALTNKKTLLFMLYREERVNGQSPSASDLPRCTGQTAAEVNDAVDLLENDSAVTVDRAGSRGPLRFSAIRLSPAGRARAEELGVESVLLPEGRARLVLEVLYQRYVKVGNLKWAIRVDHDELAELGLTADDRANALQRLVAAKFAAKRSGSPLSFVLTVEGTKAATSIPALDGELPLGPAACTFKKASELGSSTAPASVSLVQSQKLSPATPDLGGSSDVAPTKEVGATPAGVPGVASPVVANSVVPHHDVVGLNRGPEAAPGDSATARRPAESESRRSGNSSSTAERSGLWPQTMGFVLLLVAGGSIVYLNRSSQPLPASPPLLPLPADPCIELDKRVEASHGERREQGRKLSAMIGDGGIQIEGTDLVEQTVRTTYANFGERAEACRLLNVSMNCAEKRSPGGPLGIKLAEAVLAICGEVGKTSEPPPPPFSSAAGTVPLPSRREANATGTGSAAARLANPCADLTAREQSACPDPNCRLDPGTPDASACRACKQAQAARKRCQGQ